MALANTIIIDAGSDSKTLEAVASEAILPGQLLAYTATGTFQLYPGLAQLVAPLMVATENLPEGQGVDDAYAIGDKVCARYLRSGDVFQARYAPVGAVAINDPVAAEAATGDFIVGTSEDTAICFCLKTDAGGAASRLITVFAK